MQTTPVSNTLPSTLGGLTAAAPTASDAALKAIDFDNFLKLLTAQLRNQDPLEPLDSSDFVAQLATFSSVEQIVGTNRRLDAIAESLAGGGISQYADWIGREAEATATPGYFDGAAPMRFRISSDVEATSIEVVIADSSGAEITRFQAQNTDAIQEWDGLANGAPAQAGIYSVNATYTNGSDFLRTETAATIGVVNEVRLAETGPVLNLAGGITVDPSMVTGLGLKN